ncbi:hypothetical protein [Paenibacillus popilliae]|uniref:Uncharacterized protein n=1 Tax=Paenibacillus popilliae TaxID=78057 RepID=A0ABY3AWK1_PAEPP|nr:hypothetical protein [Paenibacillus sp. SDF0028]TQR47202.1 hypothetical protein C7Y44_06200 [Paenibacillus sp. SDF0028]
MVPAYLTPLLLMAYFFIIKRKEAGRSRNAVTVQAMLLTDIIIRQLSHVKNRPLVSPIRLKQEGLPLA